MDDPQRDDVLERLDALERQNRWMWRIGIGAVVAAIVFLAEGTNRFHPPKIVEAQGFVLKDETGRVRGQFKTMLGGVPELSLFDGEGNKGVKLSSSHDNSSSLDFYDDGRPRIELTASSDGSARFQMTDDNQENRLALFLRSDGATGQAFENAKRGFHVGVQPDGVAGLCVVDELGRELERHRLAPDEVRGERLYEAINGTGQAPFRWRGAPTGGPPSPLLAPDRHVSRAGEGIEAALSPQGETSHL